MLLLKLLKISTKSIHLSKGFKISKKKIKIQNLQK